MIGTAPRPGSGTLAPVGIAVPEPIESCVPPADEPRAIFEDLHAEISNRVFVVEDRAEALVEG